MPAVCSVSGRCSETMSLSASSSVSGRQPGWPSSRVLVCSTLGAHGEHDRLDPLRDVAVADQPDRAAADVAHRLAEASGPTASRVPSRVARSSAGSRRSAASISSTVPSATEGAFAPGMFATAMPSRVAVVDVDGVDPGAQLVHQLQPRAPARGRRPTAAAARARSPRRRAARGRRSSSSSSAQYRMSSQSVSGARNSVTFCARADRSVREEPLTATASRSTWRSYRPARCARPAW